MERWLESITDEELARIVEYVEKAYQNESDEELAMVDEACFKKARENSWIKKHKYRRMLKKRFLSVKPNMNLDECYPLWETKDSIYVDTEVARDGGTYCLNHINHLYMTKRGHIEQFRGRVEWRRGGTVFGIGNKEHEVGKITNRRIRHEKIDMEEGEALRYSTYKKKYGPKLMDIL